MDKKPRSFLEAMTVLIYLIDNGIRPDNRINNTGVSFYDFVNICGLEESKKNKAIEILQIYRYNGDTALRPAAGLFATLLPPKETLEQKVKRIVRHNGKQGIKDALKEFKTNYNSQVQGIRKMLSCIDTYYKTYADKVRSNLWLLKS
jgi:predicted HTH transcriptional regulator